MRILFFHNPIVGHVLPLLPLARAFGAAGHTVAFVSSEDMKAPVNSEGYELLPAGVTTAEALEEVLRRTGVHLLGPEPSVEAIAECFAGVRIDLGIADALAAAEAWKPDLVVFEHLDFVGPLVAAVRGVPSVVVAIDPDLGEVFLGALREAARPRYAAHALEVPARVPHADLMVDLCPPSLQDVNASTPLDRIALRPEPHRDPEGIPLVGRAPAGPRPRVLVGLSTVADGGLGPLLRELSALDIDLVATTGGAPAADLGLEPGRAEVFTFLPAAELLKDVTAAVHHGGSGATFGAAAHGVPVVVVAGTDGQAAQAERIAGTGAGLALLTEDPSPEAVCAALMRVLHEPSFAAAAGRLREEIEDMPAASEVAERLVKMFA
ncbi:glycosyltransferase [Streptomyces sp. NPDC086010]|uniref:glycosyltransferase n=1 Tax=Streptomyces sp. NPDC086010 TaxID=3365745 RepID=UPI0037CCF4A9